MKSWLKKLWPTLSSDGQRYKCWKVPMMFLLKRGANTSLSWPNWCRDCLTMESMTYSPGTLYSGLHWQHKVCCLGFSEGLYYTGSKMLLYTFQGHCKTQNLLSGHWVVSVIRTWSIRFTDVLRGQVRLHNNKTRLKRRLALKEHIVFVKKRLIESTVTHFLNKLLHALDNMFVELKNKKTQTVITHQNHSLPWDKHLKAETDSSCTEEKISRAKYQLT